MCRAGAGPVHRAPAVVVESALTVDGWIPVDPRTLQTRYPGVYAVGDVTSAGTPKAGVFAEGQATVVAAQISAQKRGTGTQAAYDGRGICYLELGQDMVAKVDVTFASGQSPVGDLEGPSADLVADKVSFGSQRAPLVRQDLARHPAGPATGLTRSVAGASPGLRSGAAAALGMSRREMLRKRQITAPLMPRRTTHRALRPPHRRLQPRPRIRIQPPRLRHRRQPHRPPPRQLRHQPPVLPLTLLTPAAPRPRQHRPMRRQRPRQIPPPGHTTTVKQPPTQPVPRDDPRTNLLGRCGTHL